DPAQLVDQVEQRTAAGLRLKDAVAEVAGMFGVRKKELYEAVLAAREQGYSSRERTGAALVRHSCHSRSGSESAVTPPPPPSCICPSASSRVRMATFSSRPAIGETIPIAPQ